MNIFKFRLRLISDSRWLGIIFLIVIIPFVYSCVKKSTEIGEGGQVSLTVDVGGANVEVPRSNLKASIGVLDLPSMEDGVLNKVSVSQGNFAMDIVSQQGTMGNDLIFSNDGSKNKVLNNSIGRKLATPVPMKLGVTYRFILYNTVSNSFEASVVGTTGSKLNFSIASGQLYRWYAYSFNNSDNIAALDLGNPVITTPTNSPLLYASGTVSATTNNTPLSVTFDHQLTQLQVRMDARGMYSSIEVLSAEFADNYVKTSGFNIVSGTKVGVLTSVDVGDLSFSNEEPTSSRVKVARYYTADSDLSEYEVLFKSVSVKYPDDVIENLNPRLPSGGLVKFDGYTPSNVGNVLTGNLKLWLVLPTKNVITYGSHSGWGYAAEAGRASGEFLRGDYNFGLTSNYLKVDGLTFNQIDALAGRLATNLSNPATYPDVIVMGIFGGYANTADYAALETYLRNGGVVFLMTENVDSNLKSFLDNILSEPGKPANVTLQNGDTGGSLYRLNDVDADVLNGVFGDVRHKLWG